MRSETGPRISRISPPSSSPTDATSTPKRGSSVSRMAVVDGSSSDRLPEEPIGSVAVLRAGRGRDAADDRIVSLLRDGEVPTDVAVTVVTADRDLRDRVTEVRPDARLVGPTWLRHRLPAS